jgi:hypothetical protein
MHFAFVQWDEKSTSSVMKLDNKLQQDATGADMSLMFILGVTVGAAVPLLVMAAS